MDVSKRTTAKIPEPFDYLSNDRRQIAESIRLIQRSREMLARPIDIITLGKKRP
jgi:hypothetical protein